MYSREQSKVDIITVRYCTVHYCGAVAVLLQYCQGTVRCEQVWWEFGSGSVKPRYKGSVLVRR